MIMYCTGGTEILVQGANLLYMYIPLEENEAVAMAFFVDSQY